MAINHVRGLVLLTGFVCFVFTCAADENEGPAPLSRGKAWPELDRFINEDSGEFFEFLGAQ